MVKRNTRDRILDAGERLFAEKGFKETTLRDVSAAAAVNAGSLYHFFKTKASLVQAVFSRRLIPQDEERLRRLRLCEEAAAPQPPSVEAILHALIGPLFEAAEHSPHGNRAFMKLMVQAYAGVNADILDAIDRSVGSITHVFAVALSRALPQLSAERLFWRMHFALSSVATIMSGPGRNRPPAPEDAYREIIPFLAAGLQAPEPAFAEPVKHGIKVGERQNLRARRRPVQAPLEAGSTPRARESPVELSSTRRT